MYLPKTLMLTCALGCMTVPTFAGSQDKNTWGFFRRPPSQDCEPQVEEIGQCELGSDRDCNGFFAAAEFLYWKTTVDNTPYVSSCKPINYASPFFDGIRGQKMHSAHFHFNPGFRVGVGYRMAHDYWDLFLNWTDFRARAQASKSASSNSELQNTFDMFHIIRPDSASGKQKMHLDALDLELGRSISVSSGFVLRPHLGVRGAILNQDLDLVYKDSSATQRVRLDNDFKGIGLRGGLNAQWNMRKGWGLYGKSAFSLLAGWFDVSEISTLIPEVVTSNLADGSNYRDFFSVKSVLELAMGLNWQTTFCRDRNRFMVYAGYEFNLWPSQNQLFNIFFSGLQNSETVGAIASVQATGDVAFQGLQAGARIDF